MKHEQEMFAKKRMKSKRATYTLAEYTRREKKSERKPNEKWRKCRKTFRARSIAFRALKSHNQTALSHSTSISFLAQFQPTLCIFSECKWFTWHEISSDCFPLVYFSFFFFVRHTLIQNSSYFDIEWQCFFFANALAQHIHRLTDAAVAATSKKQQKHTYVRLSKTCLSFVTNQP